MKSKSAKTIQTAEAAAAEKAKAEDQVATYLTSPHAAAAGTLQMLLKSALPDGTNYLPDLLLLQDKLMQKCQQVNQGDLSGVEATLESQAIVLNYIFHQTIQLAAGHKFASETFERTTRLALRAQAQAARTLEILANIKQGPRVVFAQQLNAAHQQIVNNSTGSGTSSPIVCSAQKDLSPPEPSDLPSHQPVPTHATLDT